MATITATIRTERRSRNAEETETRTVTQCRVCSGTGINPNRDVEDETTLECEECGGLGWVFQEGGKRIEPDADDDAQRFDPETNQIVSAKRRAQRQAYGARLIAGVTPGSRFPKTIT